MMPNFELAIVQSTSPPSSFLLSFVIAAAMLLLTLIESYLVVGGGVILLGFGAIRFDRLHAEGYFGYVIRVGVRLLFFYLVLAHWRADGDEWKLLLSRPASPSQRSSLGGPPMDRRQTRS